MNFYSKKKSTKQTPKKLEKKKNHTSLLNKRKKRPPDPEELEVQHLPSLQMYFFNWIILIKRRWEGLFLRERCQYFIIILIYPIYGRRAHNPGLFGGMAALKLPSR